MAEATTSSYESNYIKIAMVVLRVSPCAVRVQFDNEFRPHRLQNILNRNVLHLTNLKEKKRITQPQWELLFPTTGKQPSSKDFDITLMICLLRNLIPIDIMDNRLPPATDTSLRADLSRIKYYRNFIVHCNDALVDDTDFESYWNDVTPAILRLGGNSLKVECDDWYGRNLDAKQRDDSLKCINAEKRLALVEEELQEQSKELAEQSKELAEQSKVLAEQSKELAEQSKELAEQSKKSAEQSKELTELKQEHSKELAEQSKELAEQSKVLAEQSKELAEQSKELAEQSKKSAEQSKELTELKQEHSKELAEQSKELAEQSKKSAEQSKELRELKQEHSKELAEQSKVLAEQSKELAEQSKELAEQSKKSAEQSKELTELKQEHSKELAEQSKELAEQSKELAEQSKELAEQRKKFAEQSKELAEIKQEQSNPVPKSIRELFTEEIESWEKGKFFETSAVATILKEVRNKSFVVIRGPSGIGKSTIVKLVALQLQNNDGYHILPVTCPEDIVKYLDPNIKQIYIIDDICGKFSVDPSMINSWHKVKRKILKYCKNNKKFRVLGTCRLQISVSSQFRKLKEQFEMVECNLLQKNFLYSKKDKLKIAACHIDEETIKQLDDKILSAYDMFPLLCMMYAASESNPGVRFFEYPLEAIEEQLDEMSKHNESCFIGLALIVVYNNKLYKHLLQNRNDPKFKNLFNGVFEDLGLANKPSKRSVLLGLQALEGNFTKELESKITFIHDKIFDMFSLYFGKRIPKTILTHGSGTFIAEAFLFESVIEDCDDHIIAIPSELEDSYFNRMVEEIENNRFYNVFKNVQVQNELYQEKFISFLSKNQSIIQKLIYNRWPLYLSAAKGCKLFVQFILNEKKTSGMCNKLDKDGNHQDMLKDKPESDMYACSYDSDSNSKSESRNSGICNELDNQNIIMDKPESDMHGCRYDPDSDSNSESESGSNFDDVNDNGRTTEEDRIKFENSPMVAACEGGYIDIVKCLVKYGYNIDHSDTNLPTPLFSACRYGNKDVVDFLLKENCKVNTINAFGQIALHVACKNGHIDIVNILLKYNSDVNLCTTNGSTLLHIACDNGHIDIVNILLKCNSNVNLCNPDGFTPLHLACCNGHIDIVNILLKHNSNVNLGTTDGFTPLHLACCDGHIDIVNSLLKYKSDVNLCSTNGYTPLFVACCYGHIDIVNILLKCNSDVNLSANNGYTPLHVASINGYKDIVDIFNKLNVDINLRGDLGEHTPIHYACLEGHTDSVKLLLDNNCDVIDNNDFSPAFHFACEGGSVDIVDFLLRNKCNINQCQPRTNESPLIVACDRNKEAVVKLLLSYEACDVNIIDCDNCNALHYACRNGQADIVELLLKRHCNINQCCKLMKTPLILAVEGEHTEVVEMLLKNKCDIDIYNRNGPTSLDIAVEKHFIDIENMLLNAIENTNARGAYTE